MVNFDGMIPTLGISLGKVVNMLFDKQNKRSIVASNAQSVGVSETTGDPYTQNSNRDWNKLTVDSIYASAGKILALGSGITSTNQSQKLAWTNNSGDWVIGYSPIAQTIRPKGIGYSSGKFVIATGGYTIVSDFKYKSSGSSGLVKSLPGTAITNTGNPIDSISTGSTVMVGASLSRSGTWTVATSVGASSDWGHQYGEAELVKTNHRSTSYTFPGYTATAPQIQRPSAIPFGDKPPVDWTTANEITEGYYGVNGNKEGGILTTFTTTWSV
jgi:hypothetical protein